MNHESSALAQLKKQVYSENADSSHRSLSLVILLPPSMYQWKFGKFQTLTLFHMPKNKNLHQVSLICEAAQKIIRTKHYSNPGEKITTHFALVKIKNLPANLPFVPGPRRPNPKAQVCAMMRETLENDPESFPERNHGITLVVTSAQFNNRKEDNSPEMTLSFADESGTIVGGLVDGGHTYQVLQEYIDPQKSRGEVVFLMKILEEIPAEEASKIARSLRANAHEDCYSKDFKNGFDSIKTALTKYEKCVAYSENQEPVGTSEAKISVLEIITLMTSLDRATFPKSNTSPYMSYSKTACYRKWQRSQQEYAKLYPILPSILELYEHLQQNFRRYYLTNNTSRNATDFFSLPGIKMKDHILPFSGEQLDHEVSRAYLLPILASLRFVLVEGNDGNWIWKSDPKEVLDTHGSELVFMLLDYAKRKNDLQEAVRDKFLWSYLALKMQAV